MAKKKKSASTVAHANKDWFSANAANFPGNIIKPHGREHTTLLFWKFSTDPSLQEKTKLYFGELALNGKLTSAKEQVIRSSDHNRNKKRQELFMGLYLTESGLRYFDWPTEGETLAGLTFREDFPQGKFLEESYHHEIDGVLCLAHDSKPMLINEAIYYRKVLEQNLGATLIANEDGGKIKNENGQSIEVFGYPDDISQPNFWDEKASVFRPIGEILVQEPESSQGSFGSYLTYLKLEQDIGQFIKLEKHIGEILTAQGAKLNNSVGEMVIGRKKDGQPLGSSAKVHLDNFDFSKDKDGLKCPFHAHIRKMNPRDPNNQVPLIVRRGLPFGISTNRYNGRTEDLTNLNGPIGLLFMSFQNNMDAFMHFWNKAKETTSAAGSSHIIGADPIIGYCDEPIPDEKKNEVFKHTYPVKNDNETVALEAPGFGGVVKLRGALQLYAPSLAFLKKFNTVFTRKNPVTMPSKILKPFKLFGEANDSFLQTLIRYHSSKAAIDSDILAYNYNDETHGPGKPPPDKPGYIEKYTAGLDLKTDELAFEFFFPVRKGDVVCLHAELVDWSTGEIKGIHYNDMNAPEEPRNGTWVDFKAEYSPADELNGKEEVKILFDDPNINHGYCRLLLVSPDEAMPLQDILEKDLEGREIKRYLLRVKSKTFPFENYSNVAYMREDSLMIVIKRRSNDDRPKA